MKIRRHYRLPDGSQTTDQNIYLDTWHAFAEPICKHTGLVLMAFDPEIVIGTQDYRLSIHLPVWFCERLNIK